jgi:hypothetical protein
MKEEEEGRAQQVYGGLHVYTTADPWQCAKMRERMLSGFPNLEMKESKHEIVQVLNENGAFLCLLLHSTHQVCL